jgi:hypothetical protein
LIGSSLFFFVAKEGMELRSPWGIGVFWLMEKRANQGVLHHLPKIHHHHLLTHFPPPPRGLWVMNMMAI